MLNIYQLRQLAEQMEEDAETAEARVGIFHEEHEADLIQLAVTNAAASRQFYEAIAARLADAEKEEPVADQSAQ
jgi:hypothetical protein